MVATLLEMKFKLFSRLLGSPIAKLIATILAALGFSALFIYLFGWIWGLIIIAGFLAASFGIGYGLRWIAKDATLAALMVMVISFMAFMVISPVSAVAFTNHTYQLASSGLIALALLGFALMASWNIGHKKSIKNTLNAVAVFSVFVCGVYFGLYLSLFWCLVLLVVLSVYDLVAVLWLKTMQVLASSAVKEKLPMMLVFGSEKEIDEKMKSITSSKPQAEQKKASKSSILGVGDLAVPSFAICSAVFYSPQFAPFLVAGACFGMVLNSLLLRSGWKFTRRGVPALPLLALGMFIFLGIAILL